MSRLSAIVLFAALLYNPSPGLAQAVAPSLGAASGFAILGGPAVTCTDTATPNIITDVTGDVGVLLGTGFTNTGCTIVGTVHAGDGAAAAAYAAFLMAYSNLATQNANPLTCDSIHRLTGPLGGLVLTPGVYCVDDVAKTGVLTLNPELDVNATWVFLVDGTADHALTGTNFRVVMMDGGQPCNVYWWVKAATTMTDSTFLGTILGGAAITFTRGTLDGRALATAAVTVKDIKVTGCSGSGGVPPIDKCEPPHHGHHDQDGDDDHDGDHGGHHDDKDGHGHHNDKDDDHKGNNRHAGGSENKGQQRR